MNTKEKILLYADFKGFSPYKMTKILGLPNGSLKSGKDFGADKIKLIRDKCLDLNMNWFLYDEGNMLLKENHLVNEPELKYGKDVKEMLYEQIKENIKLKEENKVLQETVERLKKDDKQISN